jgi:hypothetical protein
MSEEGSRKMISLGIITYVTPIKESENQQFHPEITFIHHKFYPAENERDKDLFSDDVNIMRGQFRV